MNTIETNSLTTQWGGKNQTIIKLLAFFLINKPLELHTKQNNEYSLGEICDIKTGQTISKQNISNNPGIYPVINSGVEPLGWYNKYNVDNSPLGITSRGANVGYITWQEGKYWHGGLNYLIIPKDGIDINLRYLYYNFKANQNKIYKLCEFNGIPALNASNLKKLEIKLPPLPIQKAIVQVLDIMYNNISSISDEINLREQQYQYYRDSLLLK